MHPLITYNQESDTKLNKNKNESASIEDLIQGTVKLNGERQYGMGVDTLRLWALSKISKDSIDKDYITVRIKQIDDIHS